VSLRESRNSRRYAGSRDMLNGIVSSLISISPSVIFPFQNWIVSLNGLIFLESSRSFSIVVSCV
jgi:hypothetical protein